MIERWNADANILINLITKMNASDVTYDHGEAGFKADYVDSAVALGFSRHAALEIFKGFMKGNYQKESEVNFISLLEDDPPRVKAKLNQLKNNESQYLAKPRQKHQQNKNQRHTRLTGHNQQDKLILVNTVELKSINTAPPLQTRTLRELQHQKITTADFLVQDIFPAVGVGVLGGAPKVGKSLFARMLAYDVADPGVTLFLGHNLGHGPVLYCDLENDESGLKQITYRMLGDAGWPENYHCLARGELPTAEQGGLERLRQWCLKFKPGLVVIDNYVCFRTTPS